jgi:hypothetical protein
MARKGGQGDQGTRGGKIMLIREVLGQEEERSCLFEKYWSTGELTKIKQRT